MSLVLYIIPIIVGGIIPFYIRSGKENYKRNILLYGLTAVTAISLFLMVHFGVAGLPSYREPEATAIGVLLIVFSLCIARINRLVNPERLEKKINNHHNHKRAA